MTTFSEWIQEKWSASMEKCDCYGKKVGTVMPGQEFAIINLTLERFGLISTWPKQLTWEIKRKRKIWWYVIRICNWWPTVIGQKRKEPVGEKTDKLLIPVSVTCKRFSMPMLLCKAGASRPKILKRNVYGVQWLIANLQQDTFLAVFASQNVLSNPEKEYPYSF